MPLRGTGLAMESARLSPETKPSKKRGQTSQMNTLEEITQDNANPFSLPSIQACNTRGTILIVEDDRSIRRYLEVILQRAGYCVVAAADGLEAMKAALGTGAPW